MCRWTAFCNLQLGGIIGIDHEWRVFQLWNQSNSKVLTATVLVAYIVCGNTQGTCVYTHSDCKIDWLTCVDIKVTSFIARSCNQRAGLHVHTGKPVDLEQCLSAGVWVCSDNQLKNSPTAIHQVAFVSVGISSVLFCFRT